MSYFKNLILLQYIYKKPKTAFVIYEAIPSPWMLTPTACRLYLSLTAGWLCWAWALPLNCEVAMAAPFPLLQFGDQQHHGGYGICPLQQKTPFLLLSHMRCNGPAPMEGSHGKLFHLPASPHQSHLCCSIIALKQLWVEATFSFFNQDKRPSRCLMVIYWRRRRNRHLWVEVDPEGEDDCGF